MLHLHMFKLYFHTQWYFDLVTMALELNNALTIYYQMDAIWSVGLVLTYFAHPDYLVIQDWIHATCLYPYTINQSGPHVYHYVMFFLGGWATCLWMSHVTASLL